MRFIAITLLAASLTACASLEERVSRIGQVPPMTPVSNPVETAGYTPVSLPLPPQRTEIRQPNSLWKPGARSFFKDLRASEVGDLVTVVIEIEDDAQLNNTSIRTRANTENSGVTNALGAEEILSTIFSGAFDPTNMLNFDSSLSNNGTGTIDRGETINLRVAGVITQKLPNGNLVMVGRQEVRVNYEVRELQVAGIIRPQDITTENTIPFDKIAEARVSYGGRGHISDVQKPRYGQEVLDIILPF